MRPDGVEAQDERVGPAAEGWLAAHYDDVVAWRRTLHAVPELGRAEILEPHVRGWAHGMKVFRWHEWMSDLGMDASKPFERQVLKVVPHKILYTETWLWKLGFHAKQKWERTT